MTRRTYTTTDAAAVLGVPRAAIKDWKRRGKVRPVDAIAGRGRGGVVPLYDLEELRPLATAYHERTRRHAAPEEG